MAIQQQQGRFALDNVTYDLITILHEKSKGLEAYEKYMRDVQNDQDLRNIFEEIRNSDEQHIQRLQQHLSKRLNQQSGGQNKAA